MEFTFWSQKIPTYSGSPARGQLRMREEVAHIDYQQAEQGHVWTVTKTESPMIKRQALVCD